MLRDFKVERLWGRVLGGKRVFDSNDSTFDRNHLEKITPDRFEDGSEFTERLTPTRQGFIR
ncbi:MAG: hypothetical protein QOD52_2610 [Gaiellaceae bacterium]|nr:hypothetical protein [Gaiellaceae bacterium]